MPTADSVATDSPSNYLIELSTPGFDHPPIRRLFSVYVRWTFEYLQLSSLAMEDAGKRCLHISYQTLSKAKLLSNVHTIFMMRAGVIKKEYKRRIH